MKLSLCKVHLRMFQYCLDISQLLMKPNGARFAHRCGVPSQGHTVGSMSPSVVACWSSRIWSLARPFLWHVTGPTPVSMKEN